MKGYPPGSLIADRYEVDQAPDIRNGKLAGRMGLVYICHDTEMDRVVALKTFRPELLHDRPAREHFLSEGRIWVNLGHHPHIVRCYDVKYLDPAAFLVMERIVEEPGRKDASLRAWMGKPLPMGQALLFALQIARGMQHAVRKIPGFVHCDLTPGNVLVGADKLTGTNINRLRVTDFGLIKIVPDASMGRADSYAKDGKLDQDRHVSGQGTPFYMAPEQWENKPEGAYTDIYALGCILYDLLTGQPAEGKLSLKKLKSAHCSGKLRPVMRKLPEQIHAFLNRCLAIRPDERYRTWNEVITVLEELYAGLGQGPAPEEIEQNGTDAAERQSVASSYNEMGASTAHLGKASVALGYFENALSIFREIGDRRGEGASLRNLGNVYAALGEASRALGYYEQYLAISREIGNRRGEGNALGNIGEVYRNQGDARRAIGYYEQYLAIVREIGNQRGEGSALGSLGLAYAALGDVNRAIGYYQQQLGIAREIGDRRGEGSALGNLGNAYLTQGEARRAIDHYNLFYKIAREIGDRIGEGNALGSLGNAYLTLGETSNAIEFYEMRRNIASQLGDRRGESNALGNLGIAYARLGKVCEALLYYKQRLEIADKIDDKMGICSTLFNVGNLYIQNGQDKEAFVAWGKLYILARQLNLDPALQKLAKLAPKVGLPDGLAGWERLVGDMQKQGMFQQPEENGVEASGPVYVTGCNSTSAGSISAQFDRSGYPNLHTDPNNGGAMPSGGSSWPTWTDVAGDTYTNNPLSASHMGVDGRTTRDPIDDYWVSYLNIPPNPYKKPDKE